VKFCLYCGNEIIDGDTRRGRKSKFCPGSRCRVGHHRREIRYRNASQKCNEIPSLKGVLILELFPGAGLFGRAFEEFGATVVRAPDILWGGDIHEFHGVKGKFDGVIGGPPCQFASRAAISGSKALNLIPEFVRVVKECEPKWSVMENVREARAFAPIWDYVFLRDWDCGGHTHRRRGFWFYGIDAPPAPSHRPGTPEYSVLASNWNRRGTNRIAGHLHLTPSEAARLQGFPDLHTRIMSNQPGWKTERGTFKGVSLSSRETLAVHMLGNDVPKALGSYIAHYVAVMVSSETSKAIAG
jgi:site-specific DNA-cytosine methylase